MKQRIIMHMDMDAFFAAVEQATNPALKGRPVIVCGKGRHGVVAAASYEAKAKGVKSGMNSWEAKRLCPDVIPVAGSYRKYIHTSTQIINICESFTPQVEIYSIDESFMDITESLWLFGSPEQIGRQLRARVKNEVGLDCSVGISSNKLLAKLATKLAKPNGLRVLRDDEVPELLERLQVDDLWGIGSRLKKMLNRLGIYTVRELGRYPEEVLVKKMGVWGHIISGMGRGEYESRVVPYEEREGPKSVGHSRTFERDIDDHDKLRQWVMLLSEAVARRLRRKGLFSKTVALTVRYKDFSSYTQRCTFSDYSSHGPEIARRAWKIFEQREHPLPVRLLGVSATSLIRTFIPQSLFLEERRRQCLNEAIDQIGNRYGDGCIAWGDGLGDLSAGPIPPRLLLRHRQRTLYTQGQETFGMRGIHFTQGAPCGP